MRIAVTGSSGLLGSSFMDEYGGDAIAVDRSRIDLTQPATNLALLRGLDVEALVHCAANTDVDGCERDPSAALRDNTVLTESLAQAAAQTGTKLVYFSSTGVYGTAKETPFTELDPAEPTTAHHRSKLLGEQAVLRASPSNLVLRTGWLFGGPVNSRKNFVANRIRDARCCDGTMASDQSQRGVPTWTRDVVERTKLLLNDDAAGVHNLVSEGSASRFDYVSEIVRAAGIDVRIEPANAFQRLAPVSSNEMALNLRMDALGYPPMPSWKKSLESYIATIIEDFSD